jgi:hypothetical protein
MVTFLFTSIVLLAFLVVALYLWQKPAARKIEAFEHSHLPAPAISRLFGETVNESPDDNSDDLATQLKLLVERASAGDNTAAQEAHLTFDRHTYDEILTALVKQADSDAKLLSVLSYIIGNELPVNRELAQATIKSWANAPDRCSTPRTLHISALADDARLYQGTVEAALNFWRRGLLADVSAAELRALFDGEYWVLSTQTRSSGAGFILKRALAKARRELESATRVTK